MSEGEVKIIKTDLPINKKLGNVKFEQAFDASTINEAEKVVSKNELVFKIETSNDYSQLKRIFMTLEPSVLDQDMLKQISELAFSIKSRAATGGYPLVSQIANSMYKFADASINIEPETAYMVLKLHHDAMAQIFSQKFAVDDKAQCEKLINGLEEVAHKYQG